MISLQADFTPLMFCGYHGHADVAKVLIEAGCDINAQGSVRFIYVHATCINSSSVEHSSVKLPALQIQNEQYFRIFKIKLPYVKSLKNL